MHPDRRVLASLVWRRSHQDPKEPELIAVSENVGERAYGGINFEYYRLSLMAAPVGVGRAHGRDPD